MLAFPPHTSCLPLLSASCSSTLRALCPHEGYMWDVTASDGSRTEGGDERARDNRKVFSGELVRHAARSLQAPSLRSGGLLEASGALAETNAIEYQLLDGSACRQGLLRFIAGGTRPFPGHEGQQSVKKQIHGPRSFVAL
jgi:hypothetical protein